MCFSSDNNNNSFRMIVFLLLVYFCRTSTSDFFISKQYGNNNSYVCVTNSSYALSWIEEDSKTSLSNVSSFIPGRNPNDFDSTISSRDPTTMKFVQSPWSFVSDSLNSEINDIILDRRWEELVPYISQSVEKARTRLKYVTVLDNLKNDFEIPLSIQLKQEGHVFLCNGKNPPKSNCYWLMLQAWDGKTSAIRKCTNGQIPSKQFETPKQTCSKLLKKQDHANKPDSLYISNKKWSHIKISKAGNVLSLFVVDNNKNKKELMTLKDKKPFNVTHMVIHSKKFDGFWKIHNMEYIYTTQKSTKINLGNLIYPKVNYLCISLFIAMCSSCSMTLALEDDRNNTIEEKVYNFTGRGWSEIRIMTENIEQLNAPLKFLVSTSSSSQDRFWAIDDIRICQREEFRQIVSTKNAKCQLMSAKDTIFISSKVQQLSSRCPENTMGDFCVPCEWVFGSCKKVKVCQNDKCVCLGGNNLGNYNSSNYECGVVETMVENNSVEELRYKKSIGGENGGIPYLTNIDTSSTTIKIQWTKSNEFVGNFDVKYSLVSYLACRRRLTTPTKTLTFWNNIAHITHLTPYATYLFSVSNATNVLFTEEISTKASDYIYFKEIPVTESIMPSKYFVFFQFNLKCEKVRGPLVANISVVCSDKWCDPSEEPKTFDVLSSNSFYLSNLIPFTNYILKVQFCRNETYCNYLRRHEFRTQPEAPNRVNDLSVYSKSENSVSLRWTPPYPPKGILKKYSIQYYYYNYYYYNNIYTTWKSTEYSKLIEINQCTIWSNFHCTTIDGLQKNVSYVFQVLAQNEKLDEYGSPNTVTATTLKEAPQPPYNLTMNWTTQNDLELKWKHPNESNGDIKFFRIELNCDRPQVVRNLNVDNMHQLIYNYIIESTEIQPSKQCKVYVSSDNGIQGNHAYTSDTSPPAIPELENHLEISENATLTILPKRTDANANVRFLVLISKENQPKTEHEVVNLENFRLVFNCSLNKSLDRFEITIGNNRIPNGCEHTKNPPLEPATEYNIAVQLINTFGDKSRSKIFRTVFKTKENYLEMSHPEQLALIALVLIPVTAVVLYIIRDKIKSIRSNNDNDTSGNQILLSNSPQNIVIQTQKKVTQKAPAALPKSIVHSKLIKINEFEEYVRHSIKNGELERQHALFPRGQTKPWTCASLKENKLKNRYHNLLAYDHSRVILTKIDGNSYSDYINANYIDGHKTPKAYIATQGPKLNTLDDFWQMIWQENVKHIANLANIYEDGKKKLDKYWPDINETIQYRKITVQHLSTTVFADFEHRIFNVTHKGETRKVNQLHFTSWPDHGVPLYSQSLGPFLQKILQIPLSSKSPIVIHCSAGVGRTGTILLCDICLRMAAADGSIDVLRTLQLLREQRANMVDSVEQYKLAHLVILECLVGLQTSIQCSEIQEGVERLLADRSIDLQMKYLKDTQWQDQAMMAVEYTGDEFPVVEEKNRFDHIIPEIQGRIILSHYPSDDKNSMYINAVKVDGFRSPGHYIVTQQPMPNTLGDFWRLIYENDISVIISLNEIDPKDETSCMFWPTEENPTLKPVPYITLKYVKTLPSEYYDVVSIHLVAKTRRKHLLVQIVTIKNWPYRIHYPENIKQFLAFWEASDSTSRHSHPVLVTCYDGVRASGLYVAMSFIIEKMKLEQLCDICQAVRTVRHNREQFVQDVEQFEFLYRAAVLYINEFKPYANFN